MNIYEKLTRHQTRLAVVGLGYVGMPIALAFAAKGIDVIGFDINPQKIELYKQGVDPTGEVGDRAIAETTVQFTADESELETAQFFIVAVPTPINPDHTPDLAPVEKASELVGRHLRRGAVVVFESTVYPGVTENVCAPLIEAQSGLICGREWKIGYSPERINPGDPVHKLPNIKKIVSGMDADTLQTIEKVYGIVIAAGTYAVSNIKTAEAVKVVENSQRDINIAFMNELAMVFDRMGIDTNEVVDGMDTKWNALGFRPGLVGGHCIGVDPYYFIYEAEKLGYHSQIVLAGREVNDGMAAFVAQAAIKQAVLAGLAVRKCRFVILGLTFKENCPDIRNSKVRDIIRELWQYGVKPLVCDPWADAEEAKRQYGVALTPLEEIQDADCIIAAVAHDQFKALSAADLKKMYKADGDSERILIDVKGLYDIKAMRRAGFRYWRL